MIDIAFLVPTTSKDRGWNNFRDSYLNQVLLPSITSLTNSFNIIVYIGYDDDDRLFSNVSLPNEYDNIILKWYPFDNSYKGKPTHIWNELSKYAIQDNIEYFQVCGDDISFDRRTEWLGRFIKLLRKQSNNGFVSGFSNNNNIPTQFLLHKKHIDLFGWIFPPPIENWYCDDFLAGLYGSLGIWLKEYQHLNIGGDPRYVPKNDKNLCYLLIKRYKKQLSFIK